MWNSIGDADLSAVRRLLVINLVFVLVVAWGGSEVNLPAFFGSADPIPGWVVYSFSLLFFLYGGVRTVLLQRERPARIQIEYKDLNADLLEALAPLRRGVESISGLGGQARALSETMKEFRGELEAFGSAVAPVAISGETLRQNAGEYEAALREAKKHLADVNSVAHDVGILQSDLESRLENSHLPPRSGGRGSKALELHDYVEKLREIKVRVHAETSDRVLADMEVHNSIAEDVVVLSPPQIESLQKTIESIQEFEGRILGVESRISDHIEALKCLEDRSAEVAERNSYIFELWIPVGVACIGVGLDLGMICGPLLP